MLSPYNPCFPVRSDHLDGINTTNGEPVMVYALTKNNPQLGRLSGACWDGMFKGSAALTAAQHLQHKCSCDLTDAIFEIRMHATQRGIKLTQMLKFEACNVWDEFHTLPDKDHYSASATGVNHD